MSTIDLVSLERATDLVRVNKERLQLDAWCAIIDIKRTSSEIIMICAYYAGAPNAVGATKAMLNVYKEMGID